MAETPDASRAQSAAVYVGGDKPTGTVQHADADAAEIDRQAQRLTDWASANGATITSDFFNGLQRLDTTTAEHEVFIVRPTTVS